MQNFDHIINWELKKGSHKFPGPEGGTCINEAAIVAAGFEYKRVKSHKDCPPCFSPVLSQYAIIVNDVSDNAGRQKLLPLVTRLSGSRDDDNEANRAHFIIEQLGLRVFSHVTAEAFRYPREAAELAHHLSRTYWRAWDSNDMSFLDEPMVRLLDGLSCFGPMQLMRMRHYGIEFGYPSVSTSSETAIMRPDRHLTLGVNEVCQIYRDILMEAFNIGAQAPAIDTAAIVDRMDAMKADKRAKRAKQTA